MKQKEVLEILIPAIQNIDLGCTYCINDFIDMANQHLAKHNFPYRYIFIDNDVVKVIDANNLLEGEE